MSETPNSRNDSVELITGDHSVSITLASKSDAEQIASWWKSEHVEGNFATLHRLAKVSESHISADSIVRYLDFCFDTGFCMPYLTFQDDVPFGYLETYRSTDTPLAGHPALSPTDRGAHFIVGNAANIAQGIGTQILTRVTDMLFDTYPDMGQIMGEPADTNLGMRRLCEKGGLIEIDRVDVGYKTACVLTLGRGQWYKQRTEQENRGEILAPLLAR